MFWNCANKWDIAVRHIFSLISVINNFFQIQSIQKYIHNGIYMNYNAFESDSEANQKLTLKLLSLNIVSIPKTELSIYQTLFLLQHA